MNNEQTITSIPLHDAHDPLLDRVEMTYNEAFPPIERREFSLVRRLLRDDSRFRMTAFFREAHYVGFLTTWQFNRFTYAEHFAIEPAARGGGIGGQALGRLLATLPTPLVLEVELPEDEMSRRRIGFYERLGLRLDSHRYFQPPYHPGDAPLEMRLMTYGDLPLEECFEEVCRCIHREVYGVQ